jgi:hypothetical protein
MSFARLIALLAAVLALAGAAPPFRSCQPRLISSDAALLSFVAGATAHLGDIHAPSSHPAPPMDALRWEDGSVPASKKLLAATDAGPVGSFEHAHGYTLSGLSPPPA